MNHMAICLGVATLACATPKTTVKPSAAPEERLRERVRAEETRDIFEVRLNPTHCGAPPFEVRLGGEAGGVGMWQRVFVEPDDPEGPAGSLANLLEAQSPPRPRPATAWVRGRLLTRLRLAPNRSSYPVLSVSEVCGYEGCGPMEKSP